jgi:hypothetical protein
MSSTTFLSCTRTGQYGGDDHQKLGGRSKWGGALPQVPYPVPRVPRPVFCFLRFVLHRQQKAMHLQNRSALRLLQAAGHSRESGNPLCERSEMSCLRTGFPLSRE